MNAGPSIWTALLGRLAAAPASLSGLCLALSLDASEVHPRLAMMEKRGIVELRRVDATPRRVGELPTDRSRVVWCLKGQETLPAFEHVALFTPPKPAPFRQREMRRKVDPHTKDRREPIEILAMLAGRSNYLVPTEGKSTADPAMTPIDVAHALAASPNELGAAVGLAMACQREYEWPRVSELAYPKVLKDLEHQQSWPGIVAGPLKFRASVVLWDAFHDIVRPTHMRRLKVAAKDAGIQYKAYLFLHHHISGALESEANSAASDACHFLFARAAPPGVHSIVVVDTNGNVSAISGRTQAGMLASAREQLRDFDHVDQLLLAIEQAATHSRITGVLSLRNSDYVGLYVTT
jgi:hypothetical protein